MGNETSRRLDYCQIDSVHSLMNNHNPLKFHSVHGEHVALSNNNTIATRFEGFCKGIVFSHRPVEVNEYIFIKFLNISSNWSGALRIGFTSNDPNMYKNKLPKYACPILTNSDGHWAKALAERLVKENSVLFYYLSADGDVHYGFDDVEKGIFFGGVNVSGKLWALLDIYGNTVGIQFINTPISLADSRIENPDDIYCAESSSVCKSSHTVDLLYPLVPIFYAEKIGRDAKLLNSRLYEKLNSDYNGYAFTHHPLIVEKVIMMHLCSIDSPDAYLTYGVTSCNPSKINEELPNDPDDLLDRSEYWVVQRINSVLSNDIICFLIEETGALKFVKNFDPIAIAAYVDNTLPLWFFLNLCNSKGQIELAGSYNCAKSLHDISILKIRNDSKIFPLTAGNSESFDESSNECVICMESPKDCALYRCGHACMCYDCARQLQQSESPQCPLCRENIEDVLKIYK